MNTYGGLVMDHPEWREKKASFCTIKSLITNEIGQIWVHPADAPIPVNRANFAALKAALRCAHCASPNHGEKCENCGAPQ